MATRRPSPITVSRYFNIVSTFIFDKIKYLSIIREAKRNIRLGQESSRINYIVYFYDGAISQRRLRVGVQ